VASRSSPTPPRCLWPRLRGLSLAMPGPEALAVTQLVGGCCPLSSLCWRGLLPFPELSLSLTPAISLSLSLPPPIRLLSLLLLLLLSLPSLTLSKYVFIYILIHIGGVHMFLGFQIFAGFFQRFWASVLAFSGFPGFDG